MQTLLYDLWYDLRAKRLWPVALLLVAALVAVPLVVAKRSSAPAPAGDPTAGAKGGQAGQAVGALRVRVAKADPGSGSKLDLFDPKNPFKPPKSALKALEHKDSTSAGSTATASSGSASTGSSPSVGGSSGSGSSGGAPGGGSETGSSPSTQAPTAPESGSPKKTTKYTYVADLSFGRSGHLRRHRSFPKLGILPSADDPLLVFLGVTAKGGNAAFLVDSTLVPQGEGKCKPSAKTCNFLYLGPGSEHRFTDPDGNVWTLRIDAIRKVRVKKAGASKAHASKRPKAHTATGERHAARRFVPPLFVDLIETTGK